MTKKILLVLLLLIPAQAVYAQDISMSVNQTTYYFLTGEEASIPVNIDNSYGKKVDGILRYTITQQVNQGNIQYSSSNSQSTSFSVKDGKDLVRMGFGTSDTPLTMTVNLSFNYNDKEQREIPLGPITIQFVADESQKKNESNPIQGSSQKAVPPQQDPFSQQQQQLQQRLDQMLGNQPSLPQDPQQRLQNNQLSQDSSTLKQEIQKQLQEQNQLKNNFQKELANNQQFQNVHQGLVKNGYNVTSGTLNPTSNNTGTFELQYQNSNGKWAKIQGEMKNGTLTNLNKQTQEEQEMLLDKLRQNDDFKRYQVQLEKEGFSETGTQFMQDGNKTSVVLSYQDQQDKPASISGEFVEGELKKVSLEKENTNSNLMWLIPLIIIPLIGIYFLYKRRAKKIVSSIEKPMLKEKPYNYVLESKKLLEKANELFENECYKDAYGTAAQALRLFLSYENGIEREITNEEILKILDGKDLMIGEIKDCFQICSLVEFAKSESKRDDFNKIIQNITKVIEQPKNESIKVQTSHAI